MWNFTAKIGWTLNPDSGGYLFLPNGCIQVNVAKPGALLGAMKTLQAA
ncbi:MAG: hypothetical protein M3N82_11245 [Pseudomonadota bacterium]|nr:hypothetical protein [Pseudomonadota bacterium]